LIKFICSLNSFIGSIQCYQERKITNRSLNEPKKVVQSCKACSEAFFKNENGDGIEHEEIRACIPDVPFMNPVTRCGHLTNDQGSINDYMSTVGYPLHPSIGHQIHGQVTGRYCVCDVDFCNSSYQNTIEA